MQKEKKERKKVPLQLAVQFDAPHRDIIHSYWRYCFFFSGMNVD